MSSDADDLTRAYTAMVAEAQQMYAATQQATQQATTVYNALLVTNKLQSHLRFTYFCRQRCPLLHVVTVPDGVILGWPPYKNSRARNLAESTESGRRANTTDGDRHWKAHAAFTEHVGPKFSVQCKHVRVRLTLDELQADLNLDTPEKYLLERKPPAG